MEDYEVLRSECRTVWINVMAHGEGGDYASNYIGSKPS